MLRHFILAIFLIALALPAIAVATPSVNVAAASEDCHGMSSQDDKGGDHESGMRIHSCIGCVAPTNTAPPLAEPLAVSFITFAEPVIHLSGTSPRPSLPPPRT
jgi:hypothetical protein